MAKERLSKIQKWILERCLENLSIHFRGTAEFFGKKYLRKADVMPQQRNYGLEYFLGEDFEKYYIVEKVEWPNKYQPDGIFRGYRTTPRQEFLPTNSEKVIASRSLKNLVDKGLLVQDGKYGSYTLTEEGVLKVNNCDTKFPGVSYKEYLEAIEKKKEERQKEYEAMVQRMRS